MRANEIRDQAHERSPVGQARDRHARLRADKRTLETLIRERTAQLAEVQQERGTMHFSAPLGDVSKKILKEVTLKEWLRSSRAIEVALEREISVQYQDLGRLLQKAYASYQQMLANEHPGGGAGHTNEPLHREQGRKRAFEQAQLEYLVLTQDPDLTPSEEEQARMHEEWAAVAKEQYTREQEKAKPGQQQSSVWPEKRLPGTYAQDEYDLS